MEKIKRLVFSMLKVGMIGFGGGNALIPILEQTVVNEEKMVSEDEYEEDVVVASITPGALPVEIASGVGRRYVGTSGLLLGGMAMALPGVILTILLTSVITTMEAAVLLQIRYVAVGVTAFICCLLTEYIVASVRQYKKTVSLKWGILVTVLVILLTCGKNLYRILGISAEPLFSLAAFHIFLMAFFLLFYLGSGRSVLRLCIGGVICLLYTLCVSNAGIISNKQALYSVISLMLILGLYGFIVAEKEKAELDSDQIFKTLAEISWIGLVAAVFIILAIFITPEAALYSANGLLSTLISFGGGDAYLTVADGLFVRTDLITESFFYHYVVPMVNVLPGSILCKTLSGIGYYLGFSVHGKVWEGILIAVTGFFVSLLASCGVFDLVGCFYGSLRKLYVMKGIRKWIRPIVSGLMINVILSLVWQNMNLGSEEMLGAGPVVMMLFIYVMDLIMVYKLKMKNVSIVFLSAFISLISCNLMML